MFARKWREARKQEKRERESRKSGDGKSVSLGLNPGPLGGQVQVSTYQQFRTPTEEETTQEIGQAARKVGHLAEVVTSEVEQTGPLVRQMLVALVALARARRSELEPPDPLTN